MVAQGPKVAVIGSGVTGAIAAYYLRQGGCVPIVCEAGLEIGGRTNSIHKGGFIFNTDAVGLLGSNDQTVELAAELGISDSVLTVKPVGSVPRAGRLPW